MSHQQNVPPPPPPPPQGGGGGRPRQPRHVAQNNSSSISIETRTIELATDGNGEVVDITPDVSRLLASTGFTAGTIHLFCVGSTAALTTIEFENGLKEDLPAIMEKLIPASGDYSHNATWGDGNGHSHLRASIMGPSLSIPFIGGRLMTGTWQQIVFVDWDNRARRREVIAQFIGE